MGQPQPISSILRPLLKKFGLETQMQTYALIDRWDEVVGYQIASHTLPYQVKFKKLYLYVDSPAWMNQLTFLKEELKNKINREMGEAWVQEIIMRIGSVEKSVEKGFSGDPK